jgi:hypothetical protein
MKGRQLCYSQEELAWIEARQTEPRRQLHVDFSATFARTDVSFDNFKALCTRKGWKTGRTGTFPKGSVSWNKGRPMPFNENSARTRFKKGNLPHNTHFLGHERLTKDGYVEISVDEINPHTGYERRYVMKHKHLWEKINGPVPKGMFLKCLDGNRQNTDPSNWDLLPRAAQTYLGGFRGIDYEAAEPEVRPAIIAVAKLRHAARVAKSKGGAA